MPFNCISKAFLTVFQKPFECFLTAFQRLLDDPLKVMLRVDIIHFLCIALTNTVTTVVMSILCMVLHLGAENPQLCFHCIREPEGDHNLSLYNGMPDYEHPTISTTVLQHQHYCIYSAAVTRTSCYNISTTTSVLQHL